MKKCLPIRLRTLQAFFALFVAGLPAISLGQSLSANMPFPAFNSSYISGTDINIQVTTTTPTSTTVTKVEFFIQENFTGGFTRIGEDVTAPYSFTWTAPTPAQPSRSYQVRAVVTNSASNTAVSNPATGYNGITVYRPDYVSTRNWYVSAVASSTNTAGTEALPFNTIQKAADRVAPGDIVYVMAGTYTGTSTNIVQIQRTGLPNQWITFRPYQHDKPVLQMGNNNWQAFNVLPAAAYIKIQGFEVIGNNATITLPQAQTQPGACEGPNPAATPIPRYNGNGIGVNGRTGGNLRPHHVILANNSVHDCAGAGFGSIEGDYVTIEDNLSYNNSWYTVYGTSGISVFNSWNYDNSTDTKMIIRRNKCFGNILKIAWNIGGTGTNCKFYDGNGIILDNNNAAKNVLGAYSGGFLVENNLTYLNGGRGINVNYTDNAIILNNTTYRNGVSDGGLGIGIESEFIAQGAKDIQVYNNIFSGRPGEKVTEVNSSTIAHNNNLTFEGTGTPYFTGNQNIVGQNPQFVDPANADPALSNFQVAATSPALNAGSSAPGQFTAKDILGINRPQGSGVDIGAYELQGTPISISQQPASSSAVCAGATVSVSVTVDGPVSGYQWYKDGPSGVPVALTGVTSATTATLSLPSVTTADAGSYSVVITGFNSVTSTAFSLMVNAIPTANLTASGTISCTTPTVTLTASPETGVSYVFSSGATQAGSPNSATVSQAGTYSVVVTTPGGCTASASVAVSGSLTTPAAPNASSLTVTQGTPNVNLTVSNCAGTVNWNGVDGNATLPVATSAIGALVYSVTCKAGICVSPVTSVTVTVNAPPSSLSVFHRDGDNNQLTNNAIRPYLRLHNEGSTAVPYGEITIRYWLTVENFAPLTNLSVYWAQLGTGKVTMKYVPLAQPRQGAFGYVEYSFETSAGILAGGSNSGEIQTGVGKQNWTAFTELDDHSFAPNNSYAKNERITIYRNGTLIGGTEPAVVLSVTALKVYSENKNGNPNTNQISTHLKLANEGNVALDYSQLTIRYWFSSESAQPLVYSLDYAELGNANVKSKFVKENRGSTDTYLELSFVPALGQLNPLSSTGLIQQRINKNDWSTFSEANDHSYRTVGPLAENGNITAYLNGSLVYGQEPAPSGGRISAGEERSGLKIMALGNPVRGDAVLFDVVGAEGQPLTVTLMDAGGQVLTGHRIERAGASERLRLPVGRASAGLLLLQVNTPHEKQTIKWLKE